MSADPGSFWMPTGGSLKMPRGGHYQCRFTISSGSTVVGQSSGRTRFLTRLVKEKPLGTASGIAIVIVILVAVLADVIAPYPYGERHLPDRLQGSSAQYLLGTDHLGRDLLSRIIHGARVSLTVGLAATTLNILVAVLIGGTSGFLGGKLDLVVQRFVDAWMSFPGLLLLLTIIAIVGQGLLQLIAVLGISGGIVGSRVLRSAVIGVKENDYFQSAMAIGASQWKIIIRHVLPNIAAPIMISSLFELAPRAVSWRSWSASPGPGRIDWIELNRVACGWIYGDWISGVGWR